jgi:acetoin utilization deacetylase AcuC-like enzyme
VVREYQPDYLLVSLGFDTHQDDPIAVLGLQTEDFGRLGERIGWLDLPTLHVLEGGYALDSLGESAVAFFTPLA